MRGRLDNADDMEWLLDWTLCHQGEVEFRLDRELTGLEFRADGNGIALGEEMWTSLRDEASRQRQAVLVDGRWVGVN